MIWYDGSKQKERGASSPDRKTRSKIGENLWVPGPTVCVNRGGYGDFGVVLNAAMQ